MGRTKHHSRRNKGKELKQFSKETGLDLVGELFDLSMGTFTTLATFGLYQHETGEFNWRRKKSSRNQGKRR